MSRRLFYLFFLFISLVQPISGMIKAPSIGTGLLSESVGVRTFKYEDVKRKRPVVIELWYPTDRKGPLDEPSDSFWVHPAEVRDAPISPLALKKPLIMMSHGYKGDRRERTWLADFLVRSGFIVASVDHYGNTRSTFDLLSSLKFWERARDITFAIDHLIQEPFLVDRIDAKKIGFVGYSLGGMTGLGLAGATVKSIDYMMSAAAGKTVGIKPEVLAKVDFSEAKGSFKDPRIMAMLLICPASFAYQPESLKEIQIPVGLVAAIEDSVLPFKEHADLIIKHLTPAKIKIMNKEITHYTFLNRVSDEAKKWIDKELYKDSPSCNRVSVHKEVGVFTVDFFREFL